MHGHHKAPSGQSLATVVLLAALAAVLLAGLDNVADGFADVKKGSPSWMHWGGAVAVELGLFAIGLTLAVLARAGKSTGGLFGGLLVFLLASTFANLDASLESLTGESVTWSRVATADHWVLLKATLLGGALPLMVLLVIEALRALAGVPASEAATMGARDADEMELASSPADWHQRSNGSKPELAQHRGSRSDMLRLIQSDPELGATELADRLGVARGTVYRWRDDLGAERVDGLWVLDADEPPR